MLDIIGSIVGLMAVMIGAVAIAGAVSLTASQKYWFAGAIGAWVGLASALAAAGALAFSPQQPVPLIGVLFAAPLVAAAIAWALSPVFRETLMAIPMPLLISINAMRVLGVLFLALAAAGRLSGPFPYSAGLGDMITGALALPLAAYVARDPLRAHSAVARWNLFGALDLFAAVGLGITSAAGSPLQFIHVGVGSEAMQGLPFSLVPTVLVPFYLMTHWIVAAQLAASRRPALA